METFKLTPIALQCPRMAMPKLDGKIDGKNGNRLFQYDEFVREDERSPAPP